MKYVLGEKPCGCLVAVAKDEGSDFILDCLKDGLTIRSVTAEEWESTHRDRFLADCPHGGGR